MSIPSQRQVIMAPTVLTPVSYNLYSAGSYWLNTDHQPTPLPQDDSTQIWSLQWWLRVAQHKCAFYSADSSWLKVNMASTVLAQGGSV